jgi:aminoglycoside/choline kinase family phosphotransferase
MTQARTGDADLRERIDRFLSTSGIDPRARVVPLTGDASDRKYFRVIPGDGASLVLALHAGPIQFEMLPFANVSRLMQEIPVPVPDILGHSDALGIIALQDLGDLTLQAQHRRASTPRSTGRRLRSSRSCSAAAPSSCPTGMSRIRSRSTSRS